jgi:hypothetical protein
MERFFQLEIKFKSYLMVKLYKIINQNNKNNILYKLMEFCNLKLHAGSK